MPQQRLGPIPTPPEARIWNRINKTETCWVWTGARDIKGYGKIASGRKGEVKEHRVHIVVYRLLKGDYDRSLDLHHKCENKSCCNPDHLEPLTRAQHIAKTKRDYKNMKRRQRATHCGKGHLLDEANTYVWKSFRTCRICNLEYTHRRRERQRSARRQANG